MALKSNLKKKTTIGLTIHSFKIYLENNRNNFSQKSAHFYKYHLKG